MDPDAARTQRTESEPGDQDVRGPTPVARRRFLGLGVAAAGAVAGAGVVAEKAFAGHHPPPPASDRPPPAHGLVSYEETRLAFRNHGIHLELLDQPTTPLASHYQLIHFDVPSLRSDGYQVTLQGAVNRPLTLRLADLKRRPIVHQEAVLECAGTGRSYAHPRAIYVPWFNEDIGMFRYTGTPLAPILREAGLKPEATEVVFTGQDAGWDLGIRHHFERALPIDEAMLDGVILAWEANGQPLLPAHGFPLRLIVPTWYGMASVKWLKAITVIDHPFQGVQQAQVYRMTFSASDAGRPIQKKLVRSTLVPPGEPELLSRHRFVRAGRQQLVGRAWTGTGRITRVQVTTDNLRTFQDAVVEPPTSRFAWQRFHFTWNATPGEHVIGSRATDSEGHVQPLRPLWNIQGMEQHAVERVGVRVF